MSQSQRPPSRRGRPPKFGRPAQLLTLTLPEDVIEWLRHLHPDPAWAIVKLFDRATRNAGRKVALAELAQLPGRQALILVNADVLKQLPGVSIIALADGRGFLALDSGRGIADLEIAVIDGLESPGASPGQREALTALRAKLREWRRSGLRFESRAIIVAHRDSAVKAPPPLGEIKPRRRDARMA